jgi:hypothetical protein
VFERLDSPDNVLAIRATGTIEKRDYTEVLEPAVHAMLTQHDKLRVVIVLGDDVEGYAFSAGWEDAKLGITHITKWERCAVVTSKDWIRHWTGMFRWMMPGDLKLFTMDQVDAAIAWAAAET